MSRFSRGWGLAAVGILGLASAACSGGKPPRGIVIVTLDTTRADRIGCYGYRGADTPVLDRFASHSVRFDQAMSPVPITLPAHASLFTGQYPAIHGVRYNGTFKLPDSAVTLAERLRDAGFRTAAFPAAFPVSAATGLAQGFETYADVFAKQGGGPDSERPAADVAADAIRWIDGIGDAPFFLWVHFYDAHDPYRPPEPYASRFKGREYDGEIAYADREMGRTFAALVARHRWEDTLVIVAGDHGEGLGEHGETTHKTLVYESTLRVPLLVRPPGGVKGAVRREPVSLVDVLPTILDYAGIAVPQELDGTSLRASIEGGEPPKRPLYFESLAGSFNFGWAPLDGVRRGSLKLIDGPGREVYDLDSDPGETKNLVETIGAGANELVTDLEAERRVWESSGASKSAAAKLAAADRERLLALGYVAGDTTAPRKSAKNPRDLVRLEDLTIEAKRREKAGDAVGARERYREVLRADPENRFALEQGPSVALSSGDAALALEWARRFAEVYPDAPDAYKVLGDILLETGGAREAATALAKAVATNPSDSGLRYRLALALYLSGDSEGSIRAVDETVALEPGRPHPRLLAVSAAAKARLGDRAGAGEALARAVEEGFRDRTMIETRPAFAPLRALPEYRKLLAP